MGLPVFLYNTQGIRDGEDDKEEQRRVDFYAKRNFVEKNFATNTNVNQSLINNVLLNNFFRESINNIFPIDDGMNDILNNYYNNNNDAYYRDNEINGSEINYDFKLNSRNDCILSDEVNEYLNKGYENLIYQKNNDEKFWIYYYNNFIVSDILFFDFNSNITYKIDAETYSIDISKISFIDCKYVGGNCTKLMVVISSLSGELYLFEIENGNIIFKKFNIGHNTKILNVWLGLIDQNLILSFNLNYGIIITNVMTNRNYAIPIECQNLNITNAKIDFPGLTIFNSSEIYFVSNFLDATARGQINEIKIMKRENELFESITYKMISSRPTLLVETNQRLLSISNCHTSINSNTVNWYKDTHTILQKNNLITNYEENAPKYQYSILNDFLVVCEDHLYDTTLIIYKYSKISNEWLFLGFTDIKSKFNLKKIKNLSITRFNTNFIINLLNDKNEKYEFDII
ncbi:hypothetical protein TPHA_0E02870 [Tetrapisispora phaffii CBS 4417]|uniref:Uncharacterized protein n=1 Tax=Tetrapisispora phaffii (strain ATCC 24235 / CBS 4417 / NBRC 1672 / NRRL Y-8282 / UCD 70-5) TaxID=1071381 RepID=G8BTZ9_TETPH|nr:hypothetical protein TPHA_0E02870 [Tetrapisispora phaffii CBS 4417]CCE63377.1 hypothetical protein TPHA_0E02870 [Tetrapisispora phaffii CBS 4417]